MGEMNIRKIKKCLQISFSVSTTSYVAIIFVGKIVQTRNKEKKVLDFVLQG
jgi:hypothetical protein